jgi:hypothetical protein
MRFSKKMNGVLRGFPYRRFLPSYGRPAYPPATPCVFT